VTPRLSVTLPEMPKIRDGGGYGPGMERSWFMDAAFGVADPNTVGLPPPIVGNIEEARRRLAREAAYQREQRDLTTTSATAFVPTGAPAYISGAFSEAARARGVLASILPVHDLPKSGMVLTTPRITTGSVTEVQGTENTSMADDDIVEGLASSPVATIESSAELSQQLLDRADPSFADVVMARELGSALGERLDQQLLSGSGTGGEMLGLVTVATVATTSYTDASPTPREAHVALLTAAAAQSIALGVAPDALLMSPRRRFWFGTWPTTGLEPAVITWPAEPFDVPAIPTAAEYLLLIRRDELPVFLGPIRFRVAVDWSGSATLTVRAFAYMYASNLFARRPEAIHKVSGTGIADSPTFA
jgi:hypothetical protein